MKILLKVEKVFDLKILQVSAEVRYWEDAEINGVEDENGDLTPCRINDSFCPIIDIDTGIITNWTKGVDAKIHFKVFDEFSCKIVDVDGNVVLEVENDYVPNCISDGDNNYLVMNIDKDGKIENWKFNIEDFTE